MKLKGNNPHKNNIGAALPQTFGKPRGSIFWTQPRPEPFGQVALSLMLLHNNFSEK